MQRKHFCLLALLCTLSLVLAQATPAKTVCEALSKEEAIAAFGIPPQMAVSAAGGPQRSCLFIFNGRQMQVLYDPIGTSSVFPVLSPPADSTPEAFRTFLTQAKLNAEFVPGVGSIASRSYDNGADILYFRVLIAGKGLLTLVVSDYPKLRSSDSIVRLAASMVPNLPHSIATKSETAKATPISSPKGRAAVVCDLLSVDDASAVLGAHVTSTMTNVGYGDARRSCLYPAGQGHGLVVSYNPLGSPDTRPIVLATANAAEFRNSLKVMNLNPTFVSNLGSDAEFGRVQGSDTLSLFVLIAGKGTLMLSAQNSLNPEVKDALVKAANAMLPNLFDYTPTVE